jgi:hypothetical protein
MKEQKDRPGNPNGRNTDFRAKEQDNPHEQSELTNLFQESGLFDAYTPPGREPTVFPMDVLDHLRYDVATKARRISRYNRRLADQLQSWKTSINRINMVYEIIVYPFLDVAQQTFVQSPFKDPDAPSPSAERLRIAEGIRDAQDHPDKNLDEFPHRGPITLTPLETYLLGRVAQTRGLPFDPQKRAYHYLELLPRLEARSQALKRTHWQSYENPTRAASSNNTPPRPRK